MEKLHDSLDYSLVGVIPDFGPLTIEERIMNLAGKRIGVVAGDVGGFKSALRPLNFALSAGVVVHAYCMAGSAAQIRDRKLVLDSEISVAVMPESKDGAVGFAISDFDLMVVTATQSLGDQIVPATVLTAEAIMATKAPVLALQDMYGSFHDTLHILKKRGVLDKIRCLCVSDAFSKDLLVKAGYDLGERIVVTGGPQFDAVPDMLPGWLMKREMLRQSLGASDKTTVFLIVGGKGGTAEILQILEDALVAMDRVDDSMVIFRPHPGAPDDDKLATADYLAKTKMTYFKDVDQGVASSTDALLPAAEYVLSSFGTTNTLGILCQMPGVIYVGTPGCQADLRRQKKLDRPPEVEHGAAWYVQSPVELEYVIRNVGAEGKSVATAKIKEVQQAMGSYVDGNAAKRVYEQMKRLLA